MFCMQLCKREGHVQAEWPDVTCSFHLLWLEAVELDSIVQSLTVFIGCTIMAILDNILDAWGALCLIPAASLVGASAPRADRQIGHFTAHKSTHQPCTMRQCA